MEKDGAASLPCPGGNSVPQFWASFLKSPAKQSKKLGVEAGFVLEGWQASGTGSTLSPGDASAGAAPAQPSGGEDGEAGGCRHQGGEPWGAIAGFILPPPGLPAASTGRNGI